MGKIVRYDKPTLSIVIFLILLFISPVQGYASYGEYDLLQRGYESYLSYQPEKAAEEFRTFLQEFPDSSARDAALFWLGKSLMQAKSIDEAGHVFAELKRQFPDSPFMVFVVTQTEFPENEKITIAKVTEPGPQLEKPQVPADTKQPEPAGKADEAFAEPAAKTASAVTPKTPVQKESETVMQSSLAIQQQMSELQAPMKSVTAKEEPVVKESEVKEPAVKEPEVKEPAQLPESQGTVEETGRQAFEEEKKLPSIPEQSQSDSVGGVLPEGERPIPVDKADEPPVENIKRAQEPYEAAEERALQLSGTPDKQRIDAHVLVNPDALPGIVPLDATPQPENIKAPETVVAITIVGEQEAVSPQSELSSEPAPDSMKKVEEPGGKESEVKEPIVKEPVVQEPAVKEPEVKEPAQLQGYQATREEAGKQAVEEIKALLSATEEHAQPDSDRNAVHSDETPISGDTIRRDDEYVKNGELSPQATSESDTMTYIQTALNKVGVQGALLWSTGDRNQDFIDEQILYNEAVKLNLSVDEDELNGLREHYTLNMEEVDYLKRFLLICKLIEKKAKEIPGDKIVEVISVRYKDAGQREQPELAAELQALANKGITFEEISRSYPDSVHFKTVALQELPDWVQERIQGLQNYEVGVIWSEEGYMILKPIIQIYYYDPFEALSSEKREKITIHIRSWIAELKGGNPR